MKERFKHYHLIEKLDEIYKNAIIVLDTNSLLNIYRYNTSNRKKYVEILKKVKKRIYLTDQICNEFYKNRLIIIENRTTFKENIFEMISDNQDKLLNILNSCSGQDKYNSSLSILKHEVELKDSILNDLNKSLDKIKKTINDFNQDLDISYIQKVDPILNEINTIVGDKISEEFPYEKLEEIFKDGEERFKKEIPPGYKDKDKEGNSKYNDLVIWKEIMELAKEKKSDVLFISDDRKEDWAIKYKGKDFGPRNELLKEFLDQTNQLFYSITTKRFIEIISTIHSISDTELLIKETENITKIIYEKEKNYLKKQKLEEEERLQDMLYKKKIINFINKTTLDNNTHSKKYFKTFINYKEDDESLDRKNFNDELKEKFIWNYLKKNYDNKTDYPTQKTDDDDEDDLLLEFENVK